MMVKWISRITRAARTCVL